MYTHRSLIRVRYAETDQMGFAYYGSYAAWFEVARVEALRDLGVTYNELEQSGIWMPVSLFEVRYLKPVRYDDEVLIETTIAEQPKASIVFSYRCFVNGKEVTEAKTRLFFMAAESGRLIRCPDLLSNALSPYFQ
jgi:acyl-CoA thioester hydrolase